MKKSLILIFLLLFTFSCDGNKNNDLTRDLNPENGETSESNSGDTENSGNDLTMGLNPLLPENGVISEANSGNIENNENIPEVLASISSNLGIENKIEKTEFSWNYLDELNYPVSGYGLKLSNLSSTVYEQKMNELLEQYFSDWNGSVMNVGDGTYVSVLGKSKDSNVCVIRNGTNNLPEDGEIIRENLEFNINISCGEIAEHKVADKTKLQINAVGSYWNYEVIDSKLKLKNSYNELISCPEYYKQNCSEEGEICADIGCNAAYKPVCGNDGKTYDNECYACTTLGIDTYYEGECNFDFGEIEIYRKGNSYIIKNGEGIEYSKIWEKSCEGVDGKYYNYTVSWELSGENGCGDVFAELSY